LAATNPYKFNGGTEYEEDYGVDYYNTMFRTYDPQIGRFIGADVLTETSSGKSPYNFAGNDPIFYNDPIGAMAAAPGSSATLQTTLQNFQNFENDADVYHSGVGMYTADELSDWTGWSAISGGGGGGGDYGSFWGNLASNLFEKVGENEALTANFSPGNKASQIRIDYSYGIDDGSGNVLNTDVIGVILATENSSSPTVDASKFHFVYGPGNWQQAAVINLTMKMITSWGVVSTITIPKVLYFGMPKEYKGGVPVRQWYAAEADADAVNRGFFLMKETWMHEPELQYSQIQQLWIDNMQLVYKAYGGTVGLISAKGYMSPIVDASPLR